jgi:hypothetical protein
VIQKRHQYGFFGIFADSKNASLLIPGNNENSSFKIFNPAQVATDIASTAHVSSGGMEGTPKPEAPGGISPPCHKSFATVGCFCNDLRNPQQETDL